MALNPVTLMELLRPWRTAGVTHFLVTQEPDDAPTLPPVETCNAPHVCTPPMVQPGTAQPHVAQPVQPHTRNVETDNQLTQFLAKQGSQASPYAAPTAHVEPVQEQQPNTNTATWPASWQALWQRTTPATLLWTYAELVSDLTLRNAPHRSQLMRELIGSLGLPKGSSVFWPACPLPQEQTSPNIFAGALALLQPKVVVVLGVDCVPLLATGPLLTRPFTQQVAAGRLFIVLPSTEQLLEQQGLQAKAILFLRSQLASIPSLFFTKE